MGKISLEVIGIKEVEKAYIAGIIDGEGSIMLQRFHKGDLPAPCVSIDSINNNVFINKKVKKGKTL